MAQTMVFMFLVTLTLTFNICSILSHALGMKYWVSMQRIRQVLIGDVPQTGTHTHTRMHTHKWKVISRSKIMSC